MKKLVFAAIAAIVMVSVSNAFAHKYVNTQISAVPADTTITVDTTVTEQPSAEPATTEAPTVEQPAAAEDPATEQPAAAEDTATEQPAAADAPVAE